MLNRNLMNKKDFLTNSNSSGRNSMIQKPDSFNIDNFFVAQKPYKIDLDPSIDNITQIIAHSKKRKLSPDFEIYSIKLTDSFLNSLLHLNHDESKSDKNFINSNSNSSDSAIKLIVDEGNEFGHLTGSISQAKVIFKDVTADPNRSTNQNQNLNYEFDIETFDKKSEDFYDTGNIKSEANIRQNNILGIKLNKDRDSFSSFGLIHKKLVIKGDQAVYTNTKKKIEKIEQAKEKSKAKIISNAKNSKLISNKPTVTQNFLQLKKAGKLTKPMQSIQTFVAKPISNSSAKLPSLMPITHNSAKLPSLTPILQSNDNRPNSRPEISNTIERLLKNKLFQTNDLSNTTNIKTNEQIAMNLTNQSIQKNLTKQSNNNNQSLNSLINQNKPDNIIKKNNYDNLIEKNISTGLFNQNNLDYQSIQSNITDSNNQLTVINNIDRKNINSNNDSLNIRNEIVLMTDRNQNRPFHAHNEPNGSRIEAHVIFNQPEEKDLTNESAPFVKNNKSITNGNVLFDQSRNIETNCSDFSDTDNDNFNLSLENHIIYGLALAPQTLDQLFKSISLKRNRCTGINYFKMLVNQVADLEDQTFYLRSNVPLYRKNILSWPFYSNSEKISVLQKNNLYDPNESFELAQSNLQPMTNSASTLNPNISNTDDNNFDMYDFSLNNDFMDFEINNHLHEQTSNKRFKITDPDLYQKDYFKSTNDQQLNRQIENDYQSDNNLSQFDNNNNLSDFDNIEHDYSNYESCLNENKIDSNQFYENSSPE